MLEESEGRVVGGRTRRSNGRADSTSGGGSRRRKATSASMSTSRAARIETAALGQAEGGSRVGDWKVEVQGKSVHEVGAKGHDGIQVAKHGQAKNCVDGCVGLESEGDSDRRAGGVSAWSVTMNHSSQTAMAGRIEISWVADGATELNRFKRVGVVEGDEIGDKIRALGLQPKMEKEMAGVEGAASVHETNRGRVKGGTGSQAKFDVREPIVDSNGHRRQEAQGGASKHGQRTSWRASAGIGLV